MSQYFEQTPPQTKKKIVWVNITMTIGQIIVWKKMQQQPPLGHHLTETN